MYGIKNVRYMKKRLGVCEWILSIIMLSQAAMRCMYSIKNYGNAEKCKREELILKKKMMTVFTIGVMSLSILGVPLLLKHKRKDRLHAAQ